jgi:RHS repeat-associated protein
VLTTFDNGVTVETEWYINGLKSWEKDSTGPATIQYWNELGQQRRQLNVNYNDPDNLHTIAIDFTYDAAGNIVGYGDSSYGDLTYVYDDANQLTQIIEPDGTCTTGAGSAANSGCIKIEYNANGAETKRTYPGNATVTQTIDNAGRPTRITAKDSAGATKVDIGYSYTAASAGAATSTDRTNIVSRTSHLEQGIIAGAITSYTYDSLNRLTAAIEKVGTTTSASWTYAYDDAGNRTQQVRAGSTGAAAGTINYTYDAANRIASTSTDTTTWTYDAAGNQTRNGITGQTATYNSQGAVTGIGSTAYGAMGQGNTFQTTRSADTTEYLNTPLGLTAEKFGYGGSRAFTRDSTGDATSARLSGGSRYYYAKDQLGSVVGLFDKTGTYLGGYSYSPYGEARSTGTNQAVSTNNNLRYIAGYYDPASGLYKLGARYYDPSLGRFTQFDPSGQEANPFAYAEGNPAVKSDPSGTSTLSAAVDVLIALFNGASFAQAVAGASFAQAVAGLTSAEALGLAYGFAFEAACQLAAIALGVATGGIGLTIGVACFALGTSVSIAVERFYDV